MALRSAVTPGNDAFGGGTITRNGRPTDAGGSFGAPGAAGFTSPGVPAILTARNNSGSNIRIPYARVVPLHAKDALPVKDIGLVGTGQKTAYEYDGLESGELAWVLGKSFPIGPGRAMYPQSVDFSVMAQQMPRQAPGVGARNAAGVAVGADGAPLVPHLQPNGFGPDRMQRLAYTGWIESHFITRVGRQTLDLKGYNPFDAESRAIDSELDYWAKKGAGGNVRGTGGTDQRLGGDLFAMPDLAYAYQTPISAGVRDVLQLPPNTAMPQGLFVMERGPFLRSIGTDHRPIEIAAGEFIHKTIVDRHLGSDLAQKGLEVYLKRSGVFNWVPDGVCLSKYETGPNGQADAEMDARAAQLYNVAVQGPAIVKTWTHDPKLQCMPMDKVFMLVVGDLTYTLGTPDASRMTSAKEMTAAITALIRRADGRPTDGLSPEAQVMIEDGYSRLDPAGPAPGQPLAAQRLTGRLPTPIGAVGGPSAATAAFDAWVTQIRIYEAAVATDGAGSVLADTEFTTSLGLWTAYRNTFGFNTAPLAADTPNEVLGSFDERAAQVRRGALGVVSAELSNLRLMRATSSFLAQYSHFNGPVDDKKVETRDSRCGLPIGYDAGGSGSGGGSYIVGGWCIGTVLDSAASRSVFNNVVRTAPASMALNISVNVEWWSADKLYSHYQDKEKYTKSTGAIADALTRAGVAPGNDPEDTATIAQARGGKPVGTVATRDVLREGASKKYSLDLDPEAYPADAAGARATGAAFRRGWDLA